MLSRPGGIVQAWHSAHRHVSAWRDIENNAARPPRLDKPYLETAPWLAIISRRLVAVCQQRFAGGHTAFAMLTERPPSRPEWQAVFPARWGGLSGLPACPKARHEDSDEL